MYLKLGIICMACVVITACQKPEPEMKKTTVEEEKNSITTKVSMKKKMRYLSEITLEKGPCPDREAKSYGLFVKSRKAGGKLICYYD